MISLKDCLDYSDLTEDEATTIAAHERLPYALAVELACCLIQSRVGEEVLRGLLNDALHAARQRQGSVELETARRALTQFTRDHPAR